MVKWLYNWITQADIRRQLHRQEFLSLDFLYNKYLEFYRDSRKSILARLSTDKQRRFYKQNHSILSKAQFERHIHSMDFEAQDKYIAGILLGFPEGVKESRQELLQFMRSIAAKVRSNAYG